MLGAGSLPEADAELAAETHDPRREHERWYVHLSAITRPRQKRREQGRITGAAG